MKSEWKRFLVRSGLKSNFVKMKIGYGYHRNFRMGNLYKMDFRLMIGRQTAISYKKSDFKTVVFGLYRCARSIV
ncbi:hypothetical protein LEP1GSC039_0561 [Leptospira santarosai str. 2000027870]|nr:hypothetical protein LEP1GSC039_0561 [Leptospira santarosai str. 2000027870]